MKKAARVYDGGIDRIRLISGVPPGARRRAGAPAAGAIRRNPFDVDPEHSSLRQLFFSLLPSFSFSFSFSSSTSAVERSAWPSFSLLFAFRPAFLFRSYQTKCHPPVM